MQSVRAIVEHVNVLPGITCQALLSAYQLTVQEAQLSPRDRANASGQLKSCQLPRNSTAETTYTTSPDQIDGMKLEI